MDPLLIRIVQFSLIIEAFIVLLKNKTLAGPIVRAEGEAD